MSPHVDGVLPFLARSVPFELLERVDSAEEVIARISAYHDAGGDEVGVAASTAEDPGDRAMLSALSAQTKPQTKELAW